MKAMWIRTAIPAITILALLAGSPLHASERRWLRLAREPRATSVQVTMLSCTKAHKFEHVRMVRALRHAGMEEPVCQEYRYSFADDGDESLKARALGGAYHLVK